MMLDLVYYTKMSADGATYTALDADANVKANPTVKKGVVKYIRSFVADYKSGKRSRFEYLNIKNQGINYFIAIQSCEETLSTLMSPAC